MGDTSAPPSGHMPKDGYYFDAIIRQEPIDEDNLDYKDNMEEFVPVSQATLDFIKKEKERLKDSPRALCGYFGGSDLGCIAWLPAIQLAHPKGIRSIDEWLVSPLIRPEFCEKIFSEQIDIAIENLKKIYEVLGDTLDVVMVCGTDDGTQISTFFSPEIYKNLYVPYYKKVNRWIHDNTGWKTFKHSCGAVEPLIPLFIECGFDILNPVQCAAVGMDPKHLKETYGKDITFWGGGVDTQKVLPFGTPEEVRVQVLERCEIFSKDGGFIFNAIHVVQKGVPLENIVAMFDAVKEFNGIK